MLKIRRPLGRLIFNMGIAIPGKTVFLIETAPGALIQCKQSGGWSNKKMPSYQYRKSYCGDKTILRPSYLHNRISYTGKMASFCWISPLIVWRLSFWWPSMLPVLMNELVWKPVKYSVPLYIVHSWVLLVSISCIQMQSPYCLQYMQCTCRAHPPSWPLIVWHEIPHVMKAQLIHYLCNW